MTAAGEQKVRRRGALTSQVLGRGLGWRWGVRQRARPQGLPPPPLAPACGRLGRRPVRNNNFEEPRAPKRQALTFPEEAAVFPPLPPIFSTLRGDRGHRFRATCPTECPAANQGSRAPGCAGRGRGGGKRSGVGPVPSGLRHLLAFGQVSPARRPFLRLGNGDESAFGPGAGAGTERRPCAPRAQPSAPRWPARRGEGLTAERPPAGRCRRAWPWRRGRG